MLSTTTRTAAPSKSQCPAAMPRAPRPNARPTKTQAAPRSMTSTQSATGASSSFRKKNAMRRSQTIPQSANPIARARRTTVPRLNDASRSSSEQLLARLSSLEHGHGLVACRTRQLQGVTEVAADVLRDVRVGGERDRERRRARAARGRDTARRPACSGRWSRSRARRSRAVGNRSGRDAGRRSSADPDGRARPRGPTRRARSAPRSTGARPRLRATRPRRPLGAFVDGEAVDPVHRAEQVVPWVRPEDRRQLVLTFADVVDLEPELDRQAASLRLDDRST